MKQITALDYKKLVDEVSPKVNFFKTGTWAFCIGGLICSFAELFRFWLIGLNLNEADVGVYVSVFLIFLTAMFTGLGLFHKLAKFGGAGTFVPTTGFANAVVAPALEFKTEGFVLGVCSKMFIIAGPVIVYGVVSAMLAGIIFQIGLWVGVIV